MIMSKYENKILMPTFLCELILTYILTLTYTHTHTHTHIHTHTYAPVEGFKRNRFSVTEGLAAHSDKADCAPRLHPNNVQCINNNTNCQIKKQIIYSY